MSLCAAMQENIPTGTFKYYKKKDHKVDLKYPHDMGMVHLCQNVPFGGLCIAVGDGVRVYSNASYTNFLLWSIFFIHWHLLN
jgi:hypothetical protein